MTKDTKICKKTFKIIEILGFKNALQMLFGLGFKDQKMSYDIAKAVRNFNKALITFSDLRNAINEKFRKDCDEINKKEPLKEVKKEESGYEEYRKKIEEANKKVSELKFEADKKIQELSLNEEEVEYKMISLKELSSKVERVIQPGVLLDLEFLFIDDLGEEEKKKEEKKEEKKK